MVVCESSKRAPELFGEGISNVVIMKQRLQNVAPLVHKANTVYQSLRVGLHMCQQLFSFVSGHLVVGLTLKATGQQHLRRSRLLYLRLRVGRPVMPIAVASH